MPRYLFPIILMSLAFVTTADAKLLVKVEPAKTTPDKTVIRLTIKNTFKENVDSARATLFLFDEQGKMVDQRTAWIIGGTKERPALRPDASTSYSFVMDGGKTFATNKLTFSRIILEGGKSADPQQDFEVER